MRDGHPVADAYVHLFPVPVRLGGRHLHHTGADLITQMDRHGVDVSLVITRPATVGVLADVADAHDRVEAALAAFPGRLYGAAWVAPRHGRAGFDELERRLSGDAFRALILHPEQEQFNLDDPILDDAIEVAARHGAPVVAHTSLATRGAEPWRLVRLARRFPAVDFVMSHLGADGSMLQSHEAVKIAAQVPNVLVDGSDTVTDPYATYHGPALVLGPERVLFASGEPVHQVALGLLKLDLLPLEESWRAAISGGNLLRILGLGPAGGQPRVDAATPAYLPESG
jgi:predicted TIM-barrel fold metal-dependent hydrolase